MGLRGTVGGVGAPGCRWYIGSGVPAPGMGVDGDNYTDTVTDNCYQKTAGSWVFTMNIRGLQGAQGNQGNTGATGPTGATGAAGTDGTVFQSQRITTATDGSYTWTYPSAYGGGVVPLVWALAQGPDPVAGVLVNVQVTGAPTNTAAKFQVNRTNATVVGLLGLTILAVPASVGATALTVFAKAP